MTDKKPTVSVSVKEEEEDTRDETTEEGDSSKLTVKEHIRRLSNTDETQTEKGKTPKKTKTTMDYTVLVEACKDTMISAGCEFDIELEKEPREMDYVHYTWRHYHSQYKAYQEAVLKLQEQLLKDKNYEEVKRLRYSASMQTKSHIKHEYAYQKALPTTATPTSAPTFQAPPPIDNSTKMFLPKRELPQFTGDVREWLAFWASFSEIDSDWSLSDSDKFHYLIQSTKEGSAARKLLLSFPFSGNNYAPALKSLEERYGRNNVLIKVYVRDLLQLVIEASTGKPVDFGDLVTTITSQIRNLESLGVTQDKCAQVLYPVVESCLPPDVLQAWQRSAIFKEELKDLIKFLQSEVNSQTERNLAHFHLGGGNSNSSGGKSSKKNNNSKELPTTSTFYNNSSSSGSGAGKPNRNSGGGNNSNKPSCAFCDKGHATLECRTALGMTLESKREILKNKNHCFVCLRKSNHMARECRAKPKCSICSRNHFALMCGNLDMVLEKSSSMSTPQNPKDDDDDLFKVYNAPPAQQSPKTQTSTTSMANHFTTAEVPLQTLIVTVHGTNGISKAVRAVIDPGSQKSYVLSNLAEELQLKRMGEEEVVHQLFGAVKSKLQKHNVVKIFVSDLREQNNCNFDVSTSEQIAVDIITPPHGPWMSQFYKKGIKFTDVYSTSETPISLLIGNDVSARLTTGRKCDLEYGPVAVETLWGWVLCGKCPSNQVKPTNSMLVTNLLNIEGLPLSALWELEAIGISDPSERETKQEIERATQAHFDKTVTQLTDGRYQVSLPWIIGRREKLSSNYFAASKRLRSLTKSLESQGYLEKYDQLFHQWKLDGMIEEVLSPSPSNDNVYYLPHRAVIKLTSTTTPIRPVFDGSAKTRGALSLNDCLDKGPNTLEQIPPLLIRLRLRRVGALADVKKAFQQIEVAHADRDYLRFLWLDDLKTRNEKIYRHCRVVFGVTSSPYLLGATLHHHLSKATGKASLVAKQLLNSNYVDNVVLSLDSLEEAHEFQKASTALLSPAQFDLRGWEFGPQEDEKILPVLGLLWNVKQDTLSLDVSNVTTKIKCEPSLRHVLRLVHSIFDPLGFASPFTILGKLLLRRCHDQKTGLDAELPGDLKDDVLKWAAQIPRLADLKLPRHVEFGKKKNYAINVFCDASSMAAATAIYLRVEDTTGTRLFLLAAKSRVAPKKKATIPRLELVACVLASRLLHGVLEAVGNPVIPVTFWSDSATALAWIRGTGPWGVFVTNCVAKVRALTEISSWRHVPGKLNIADLPSRGCSAKKLLDTKWWEGPSWLTLPPQQWPNSEDLPNDELVDTERKKIVTITMTTVAAHPLQEFLRCSEYPKILKSLSYWLRFKRNLQEKCKSTTSDKNQSSKNEIEKPSSAEIEQAETVLLCYLQQNFRDDPENIKGLNVFTDENGLLRTRTRLSIADDPGFNYPILLPEKNEFVSRLIRWEHKRNCHVGVSTTLGFLRERFWVVNGRRTVRSVLTKCWVCKRFSARRSTVPVAPLPSVRTEMGIPFAVTGVDAAGPLIMKGGEKVWILLFTCANYRAVHLELVDTLTADGFIRALRKFTSRRGRPKILYSDNARGFVAAEKSLKNLNWKKVKEYAATSRIEWRFNPPAAPWWGGWWERLIGLAKQLLRRILGKRVVHRWEMETLLCEVEDSLNSRPLTYSSESPDDPIPLTPNHFVRHAGTHFLPEADLYDATATRATYKKLQHLREALRSRFRLEYLGLLRGHHNNKSSSELKAGDIVLIEQDNHKRLDWPLGVILEAIPGKSSDGKHRLFRVKTKNGEMLRPIQRLFLMEQHLD